MKTQSEQVQGWEDIIFEKRNKEYGAYTIRKNYNINVLKAEAVSIGVGILIFVIPILMPKDQIIIPVIEDPKGDIVLKKFDVKVDDAPRQQHEQRRRVDASIIPITPTTREVPDEPVEPPKQDVAYSAGPDNGAATSDTDTDTDVTVGSGSNTETVAEPPKIYTIVEKMPEYDGGDQAMMKFIQKNVRYPRGSQRRGAQGTVYVRFVVSSDGSVTNVEIEKGFDKECDAEAVRVISLMEKWHAGIQNGNAVAVRKILPIKFRLE